MGKFNTIKKGIKSLEDVEIKGIVFDIDGTLLDHTIAQKGGLDYLYSNIKEKILSSNQQDFIDYWRTVSELYMDQFLAGHISFKEQRILRVKDVLSRWNYEVSSEEAWAIFNLYLTGYEKNWTVYQDVLPCLTQLNDYPLGIISNGDSTQQRKKLIKTGLVSFFGSITISNDIDAPKPNPLIFEQCAKDMNLSLDEFIYIGDGLETDALGASRAGSHGVWINRFDKEYSEFDVITIFSLEELPKIINKIS